MGARGVSPALLLLLLLQLLLSPVRPGPAQGLSKAGATKNNKNPYCSIACRSGLPHTLCQYSVGPPATCKDGRSWPLNGNERAAVLHAHNLLRNKMASGGVPPFPTAANMKQMEWDSELEQIAQRWADQCSFSHDQCRDSGRFTVGQNVAIYFSSAARFPPIETRVYSWYDEIKDYTYVEGPFSFSFATGHFTQVVWGDTHLVGCGRARYEDNSLPTQLLVCNYGPGGNVETEPLYRQGAPCTACTAGCSPTYPALCAPTDQVAAVAAVAAPLSAAPRTTPAPTPTTTPTTTPSLAVGLRSFFATENSIPSSAAPSVKEATTRPPASTVKPTTSRPSTSRPSTSRPSTSRPSTSRPSTTKPATSRPSTTRPSAPKPSTPRPSTSKPSTSRPTTPRATTRDQSPVRPVTAGRALSSTTARPGRPVSSTTPAAAFAEASEDGCPVSKDVGSSCREYRAAPLSAEERATMLDFHNAKRSAIAAGEVPGFQPAADMRQMYWDEELEALAQAWADKCQWGHDPCRSTARWSVKGQNLGLTFSLDWTFPASTDRVEDWFQELKLYNYSSGPFTFSPSTSHFTQLAWSDSYLVGCGRTRYMSEHGLPSEFLVCNYGPGGNVFGNALYREGPPCARCPLSCSGRYPALCTHPEESNEVGGPLSSLSPLSPLETLKLDEPSSPPFVEQPAVDTRLGSNKDPACPRPAGPGPACIGFQAAPLTDEEKAAILDRHNKYRSQIASGSVQGLPAAASMLQMEWDSDIAALAQTWADQCSFGYDECAKTDAFRLGQSMAIWYSQDPQLFPPPEGRVDGWFNERKQANLSSLVEPFRFSPLTAAFTQLAWADTWKLGCGRARYSSVGVLTEILVCNYGPGGNVMAGRMYSAGDPCSACPAACSTAYPALCSTNS